MVSSYKPNIAAFPMFCNKHGNSKSVFKCKKIFNYILTYHNPLGNYAYNQGMQKNMQLLKYQMHSLKCIETLKMHRNLNDPYMASFKRIHYMQRWWYLVDFIVENVLIWYYEKINISTQITFSYWFRIINPKFSFM